MSASGYTTVPGSASDFGPERAFTTAVPTLSIAGCEAEPWRVGQTCSLDLPLGQERLFGRADERRPESSLRAPLAHFAQVRPGSILDCGPLGAVGISHEQAVFAGTAVGVEMEHIGRTDVLLNGSGVDRGTRHWLRPGDVIHFAKHSTVVLVMAPAALAAHPYLDLGHPFGGPDANLIVGESQAAWDLREQIVQAVRAGGNVLVGGESGTGKELVARALHAQSGRTGRFIPVNAATLGANLADVDLFGNAAHFPERNTPERPGYFGDADGGTLFLDEFGELPKDLQAKLLRALQSGGDHMRLGDTRPRRANVNVIAATNRPLDRIRPDLASRFTSRIDVPPLAARRQDVALLVPAMVLAQYREGSLRAKPFVGVRPDGSLHVRLSAPFVVAMMRAQYDCNVRDLETYVARAMAQSRGDCIEPPSDVRPWRASTPAPPQAQPVPAPPVPAAPVLPSPDDTMPDAVPVDTLLDGLGTHRSASELSADTIRAMLCLYEGNVVRTAERLGVHRDSLRRRMQKLGIKPNAPEE
ncbi:MAG TPA: sigma 54-interacting transcriptional regulator [Polyangiaceae bacterium]|jgi:two-component system nitrogen regulation response regulator GlnG/two-component system response regulator HydG